MRQIGFNPGISGIFTTIAARLAAVDEALPELEKPALKLRASVK